MSQVVSHQKLVQLISALVLAPRLIEDEFNVSLTAERRQHFAADLARVFAYHFGGGVVANSPDQQSTLALVQIETDDNGVFTDYVDGLEGDIKQASEGLLEERQKAILEAMDKASLTIDCEAEGEGPGGVMRVPNDGRPMVEIIAGDDEETTLAEVYAETKGRDCSLTICPADQPDFCLHIDLTKSGFTLRQLGMRMHLPSKPSHQ